MKCRLLGDAAAVLVVGAVTAGCSSAPAPSASAPGTLVAGTAKVVIDDNEAASTEAVSCLALEWLTIVAVGDHGAGVTAYVSNNAGLYATLVSIRNLGGFTGSYNAGHGDEATVRLTGSTYDITGTARGFDTAHPGTTVPGAFAIKASC